MKIKVLIVFGVALTAIVGRVSAGDDFRFIGGDAEKGKIAFQRLACVRCHQVNGVEFEAPKTKKILNLPLGEEIRFVKRYSDILLAITNPQHVVTKQYSEMLTKAELAGEIQAFMPNMTKDMSAAQLIDLAVFLDKVYRKNLVAYEGEKK